MITSLFFVAVLGIFSRSPAVQLPLAIVVSILQLMMPAVLKPFQEPVENQIAICGAVVYLGVTLVGMSQLFTELPSSESAGDTLAKELAIIDSLMEFIFIGGILSLFFLTVIFFSESSMFQRRCGFLVCKRKARNSKVLPVGSSLSTKPAAGAAAPTILSAPGIGALSRVPLALAKRYASNWVNLHKIHLELMAAATKGFLVREQDISDRRAAVRALIQKTWDHSDAKDRQITSTKVVAVTPVHTEPLSASFPSVVAHRPTRLSRCKSAAVSSFREWSSAWEKFDSDHSGQLSRVELALVMRELNLAVSDEELSQTLAEFDTDGNDQLSKSEFMVWVSQLSGAEKLKRMETRLMKRRSTALLDITEKKREKEEDTKKAQQMIADHFEEVEAAQRLHDAERIAVSERKKKQQRRKRARKVAQALFDSFGHLSQGEAAKLLDADADGTLTVEELKDHVQHLSFAGGRQITEKDLTALMEHADATLGNGDGDVSPTELLYAIRELGATADGATTTTVVSVAVSPVKAGPRSSRRRNARRKSSVG